MSDGVLPRGGALEAPDPPYRGAERPPQIRLPDSIIDAAITWAVRLDYNAPTAGERQAFDRWLQADPLHGLAWRRIHSLKGFRSDLGALSPGLALDTLRTVQGRREQRGLGRRNAVKLLSLLGVGVTTGWIAREHAPWQRLLADASTAVGERKTLRLDDGSVIVLNTDSAVSTDLAGSRRRIVLHRGEILITTGEDAGAAARLGYKRPFWVQTPYGEMQALGTRFIVRLDNDNGRARISVQEGAVQLHPADGSGSVIVQPGESRWLMADDTSPADLHGLDADGWAEGVIAGKDIRLADLLAELSRYRLGRIVCDPRVADLRLSGVFHVQETDRALRFLVQTQPISITWRTRFWAAVGPA
jgi:transmembrane sensor